MCACHTGQHLVCITASAVWKFGISPSLISQWFTCSITDSDCKVNVQLAPPSGRRSVSLGMLAAQVSALMLGSSCIRTSVRRTPCSTFQFVITLMLSAAEVEVLYCLAAAAALDSGR